MNFLLSESIGSLRTYPLVYRCEILLLNTHSSIIAVTDRTPGPNSGFYRTFHRTGILVSVQHRIRFASIKLFHAESICETVLSRDEMEAIAQSFLNQQSNLTAPDWGL